MAVEWWPSVYDGAQDHVNRGGEVNPVRERGGIASGSAMRERYSGGDYLPVRALRWLVAERGLS